MPKMGEISICLRSDPNMRTFQKLQKLRSIILLSVWVFAGGCAGQPTEYSDTAISPTDTAISPTDTAGPIVATSSDPSTPITVKLILSKAPRLEEPADLAFIVSSVLDAPGTTVEILLPEGSVLVDGNLNWSGDLAANQPIQLQATMKFVKEGNWTIEAKARRDLENGDVWADAAYIYLHVTENTGQVGFSTQPPPELGEQEVPTPPGVEPQP
jgi:hypothetical protein